MGGSHPEIFCTFLRNFQNRSELSEKSGNVLVEGHGSEISPPVGKTGGQETKKHGSGAYGSGTCKQCGTHTYNITSQPSSAHPHTNTLTCVCGDKKSTYTLLTSCSSCTANSKTLSNSKKFNTVFVGGDSGLVFNIPVAYTVYHTNKYNKPDALSGGYFPSIRFFSWNSSVSCLLTEKPPNFSAADFNTVALRDVEYYNSSGAKLHTQQLSWISSTSSASLPPSGSLLLKTFPSYTKVKGMCDYNAMSNTGVLTSYF